MKSNPYFPLLVSSTSSENHCTTFVSSSFHHPHQHHHILSSAASSSFSSSSDLLLLVMMRKLFMNNTFLFLGVDQRSSVLYEMSSRYQLFPLTRKLRLSHAVSRQVLTRDVCSAVHYKTVSFKQSLFICFQTYVKFDHQCVMRWYQSLASSFWELGQFANSSSDFTSINWPLRNIAVLILLPLT